MFSSLLSPKSSSPQQDMLKRPGPKRSTKTGNSQTKYLVLVLHYQLPGAKYTIPAQHMPTPSIHQVRLMLYYTYSSSSCKNITRQVPAYTYSSTIRVAAPKTPERRIRKKRVWRIHQNQTLKQKLAHSTQGRKIKKINQPSQHTRLYNS